MVPLWLEFLKSGVKGAGLVRDDSRQAGIPPRKMGSGWLLLREAGPIGSKSSHSLDLKSWGLVLGIKRGGPWPVVAYCGLVQGVMERIFHW